MIKKEIRKYEGAGFQDIPLPAKIYTRLGKFLEQMQLAELPRIVNCLKDNLYLVGARPLPIENFINLNQIFWVDQLKARG